jgi:hypothetical protein
MESEESNSLLPHVHSSAGSSINQPFPWLSSPKSSLSPIDALLLKTTQRCYGVDDFLLLCHVARLVGAPTDSFYQPDHRDPRHPLKLPLRRQGHPWCSGLVQEYQAILLNKWSCFGKSEEVQAQDHCMIFQWSYQNIHVFKPLPNSQWC